MRAYVRFDKVLRDYRECKESERCSQAACVDGHARCGAEDGSGAQEEQHADEDVVDDADVEEDLHGSAHLSTVGPMHAGCQHSPILEALLLQLKHGAHARCCVMEVSPGCGYTGSEA